MNKPFIAYMTEQEKINLLKKNETKSKINKVIYTFFGFCIIWFGYTIFKIITV